MPKKIDLLEEVSALREALEEIRSLCDDALKTIAVPEEGEVASSSMD